MPAISPPLFRHVLAGHLEHLGAAPLFLDVERTDPDLVTIRWTDNRSQRIEISLPEATVIAKGGPVWVADLMLAKPRKRREMLAA